MPRFLRSLDPALLAAAAALIGLGLLAIASAGAEGSAADAGLWRKQLVWLGVAVAVALVVVVVDYHLWAGIAWSLHAGVLALLLGVLVVGREVGGNRSWLVLGPLRLQPSELAKWTTCLVLAAYLAHRVRETVGLREILQMGLIVGAPLALVAAQPDLGTALTFGPIFLAALVMGGVRFKIIAGALVLGLLLAPVAWVQLHDYQKERIRTVLDPDRDPSGVGYQVRQSKIAIGSGGLVGKGLFRGTQSRLDFLPAQHTDFVLAVLAEELGLAGAGGVLGLFYLLLYRGISAARASQDRLGTYLCMLVSAWIAGQTAVNVGMVLGRLPTIGVPLPLLSYGGSSLVASLAGIALVLNVHARRFVN